MTVCTLVFLVGCASIDTINEGFANVNYDDGVNAVEAKRIAQKFLMSLPRGDQYGVSAPEIDGGVFSAFPEWHDRAWVVGFPAKNLFKMSREFIVAVDKNTGNILFYQDGYYPGDIPFEMQSFGKEGRSIR